MESNWFAAYDRYERAMLRAAAGTPDRTPWTVSGRNEIRRAARTALGVRDEWMPQVSTEPAGTVARAGYTVELLTASSWPQVLGAAHLYVPTEADSEPAPLVVLCCGHGKAGKLFPGYQAAAVQLALRGAYVLVPDLIGQGERVAMGHAGAVHPFAAGTSVQGLIVMETMAWLEWAAADSRFDAERLAAIGNSGGGTLTCFLAALSDRLAVVSSSGYPSTFDYIARCKERAHCLCNVIPGIIGQLEMWQLYGSFAPKPLYLFSGDGDRLFPQDLFWQVMRKVRHAYVCRDAISSFQFEIFDGGHEWDSPRRGSLATFLADHLGLAPKPAAEDAELILLSADDTCWDAWPADAIDINELAMRLSGSRFPEDLKLWDVYPSRFDTPDGDDSVLLHGTHRRVLAQFEAFLADSRLQH